MSVAKNNLILTPPTQRGLDGAGGPIYVRSLRSGTTVRATKCGTLLSVAKIKLLSNEFIEMGFKIFFGTTWDYIDVGANTPILFIDINGNIKYQRAKFLHRGDKIVGIDNYEKATAKKLNAFFRYYKVLAMEEEELITQGIELDEFHGFIIDKIIVGDSTIEKRQKV